MKKILSISLMSLLCMIAIGCGNKKEKLICTKEQNFGTAKLEQKVEYTFENGLATESKTTIDSTFDSEDTADTFAKNFEGDKTYTVEKNGKKVTTVQVQKVAEDAKKDDVNKKENVKEQAEKDGYTCK